MRKTNYELAIDKIEEYEDFSLVTFDQFRDDMFTNYGIGVNEKAHKIFLKIWEYRHVCGLREKLNMFGECSGVVAPCQ